MPLRPAIARRYLSVADPKLAILIRRIGPCRLRPDRAREPYEALLRAIAHQQLHAAAAEAMLARFAACASGVLPAPAALAAMSERVLHGCGFSAAKVAAFKDVAARALDGTIPTRRTCATLSDDALIERLTTVRGVGRWTVEMLLIFTLGRPDVLPVDDYGVREGFRLTYGLAEQPHPRALAEIGRAWAPHRTVAAWYLWRAAEAAKKARAALSDQGRNPVATR